MVKKWAGTAYAHCQRITHLMDAQHEPDEQQIMGGLDQKFLFRGGGSRRRHREVHPLAQCQAEACYVLAKMYHIARDYAEAMRWYYKAVVLAPELELALFVLAQMYLSRSRRSQNMRWQST